MRKARLRAARVTAVSERQCPEVDRAALSRDLTFPRSSKKPQLLPSGCPGMISMVGTMYRGAGGNEVFIIICRHERYAEG